MNTSSAPLTQLKLTVFYDYICPFCYIGTRRILALGDQYDLQINWAGMEIHPETPAEGRSTDSLGYSGPQWTQMMQSLTALAEEEGIVMHKHDFTTNSGPALRLAEAAKMDGREVFYRLHESLFEAFFCNGQNIANTEILTELGQKAGMSQQQIEHFRDHTAITKRLQWNLQMASHHAIRSVPSYIIGDRQLSGAQSVSALRSAADDVSTAACYSRTSN